MEILEYCKAPGKGDEVGLILLYPFVLFFAGFIGLQELVHRILIAAGELVHTVAPGFFKGCFFEFQIQDGEMNWGDGFEGVLVGEEGLVEGLDLTPDLPMHRDWLSPLHGEGGGSVGEIFPLPKSLS